MSPPLLISLEKQGFTTSRLTDNNEQAAVDMINESHRWMNGSDLTTLEDMRSEWSEDGFDRETDLLLVISPEQRVAGYVDVWNVTSMNVRYASMAFVHPEYMGKGIGACLLEWSVAHTFQKLHRAPKNARVVLQQFINSANQPAHKLLTKHGFQIARQSYRMQINFDRTLAEPQPPTGITIRAMQPGEEQAVLRANQEAFQDHWGAVDEPFEAYYKRWKYMIENESTLDQRFWFTAMDGNEIAGVAICNPSTVEDPTMGWVWQLSVRRPWRKRGLGLALLHHSFACLQRHGLKSAGLGVDASSLTGAVALYERAGMHVTRKSYTYEYEVRPGTDLMKKDL